MKRKEDPRFIQGKGNYVDDLSFPGMLYLSGWSIPARRDHEHRHQRGDEGARRQGRDHWQRSRGRRARLAADLSWVRQADGAGDWQVRFFHQAVAVFAETRAAAVDGAEAVQVDYAPLPVVADPFTSKTDKTLLRPDRESKTNHIFHWEVGDKEGTARALARARNGSSNASGSSGAIPRRRLRLRRTSTRWAGCSFT